MRAREILREASRNIASGAAGAGWVVLALVILIGSLAMAELAVVSSLDVRAREYHQAGASIRVLKVERGIDARRCDLLPATEGIVSAGALREVEPLGIIGLGGLTTPVFEASRGFLSLLGHTGGVGTGVLVSQPLAQRWQVKAGDSVDTDQGQMRIAAVFDYRDNDGRDTRLANAVLLPVVGAPAFDECWADVWPSTAAFDSLIRTSMDSGTKDANAMIMALNPSLGQYFTGAAEYRDRVTRFTPLAAAAIGFGIGAVAAARRRLACASALHAGVSRSDLLLIALTEAGGWAGFASLLTAATGCALARIATPAIADATLGRVLVVSGAGALGAIIGALAITALTREAKLFAYFKQRS